MLNQIKQAIQLFGKGQKDEAAMIFHGISDEKTDDLKEIVERGKLALQLEENVYAVRSFARAIELQPENVDILSLLATAYTKIGNMTLASELSHKILEISPERYEPYVILGMQEMATGGFARAAEYYEKAIQIRPGETSPYSETISALRCVERHDDALKYAKKLLRLEPSAINHIPISRVLTELGKSDEAISYLEKAIRLDPSCGYAYHELTTIKKFSSEDNKLVSSAEKVLQKSIPAIERSLIHFSLGKMYNDCKEWDRAFEHFRQGNLLGKDATEPTWLSERCKAAKKTYNKAFINQTERYGSDSDVPVFIVGMPRSGTTLMEQIIASHPDADGAGELSGIARIHESIVSGKDKSDMQKSLSRESLAEYAELYLKMLCNGRESAKRVVDKQPHNFAILGLMHKLFPNSHIIHARRNPLDTCLSCYFQAFQYVPQTYDLEWLGKTYRLYRETMEHWKKVLPEGRILEVDYENVVQDTEAEARRIIDFCQLPWDDQCLEFYKASRPVITASLWQTRQPIYSSSKKRWVNYAKHLGPLVNQISEYLDDEDIAELETQGVKVKKKRSLNLFKRNKQ